MGIDRQEELEAAYGSVEKGLEYEGRGIPLPETGPKVAPLIPDDEAIPALKLNEPEQPVVTVEFKDGEVIVDEASIQHIEEGKRAEFIARIKALLAPQPQKYVFKGERSADRNRCNYVGYCSGKKETERRKNARLASTFKSEGC